ncbi:hypothetical protein Tco_0525918 [Tanacetum coccineum]
MDLPWWRQVQLIDKEGKAVDPSHYRGSAYRKALKCSKKDLSVSKRNRTSGVFGIRRILPFALTSFADAHVLVDKDTP